MLPFKSSSGLIILGLLLSTYVLALPDDRKQAIHLQADSSSFDQKSGIIIYSGKAKLQQGSLLISAEKIVVHYSKDKSIDKIEATGTPAHLEQQPKADEDIVTASANKIYYSQLHNTVELLDKAMLTQSGAIMQGHKIHYDLTRELVHTEGRDDKRIAITIPANIITE